MKSKHSILHSKNILFIFIFSFLTAAILHAETISGNSSARTGSFGNQAGSHTVVWSMTVAALPTKSANVTLTLAGTTLGTLSTGVAGDTRSGSTTLNLPANASGGWTSVTGILDGGRSNWTITITSQGGGGGGGGGGGSGVTQADLDQLRDELLQAIADGDDAVVETLTAHFNSIQVILQSEIDKLEARISALEQSQQAQDDLIADLEARVSELESKTTLRFP